MAQASSEISLRKINQSVSDDLGRRPCTLRYIKYIKENSMFECLILGDSIAVGSHMFKKECVAYAKGGITSHGWDKTYGSNDLTAKTVIISLGTNDWLGADTYGKLKEIRAKVKADRVFWIAPHQGSKPKAYHDVCQVAGMNGDAVIWTDRYQADKIHPSWAGYKELMEKTK